MKDSKFARLMRTDHGVKIMGSGLNTVRINHLNQKSVRAELVEAWCHSTFPLTGSGRTGLSEQYWVRSCLLPLQ